MKTIVIQIPDSKQAKWVDNVLTLVDEQPKVKFKVGDKAILNNEIPIRVSTEANLLREGEEIEITRVPCKDTQFYEVRYGEAVGLVEDKDLTPIISKVEFKLNVGDKVTFKGDKTPYTITDRFGEREPIYKLDDCENAGEDVLELYTEPKNITERIKTFEDACEWCKENKKNYLVHHYIAVNESIGSHNFMTDLIAYLKLRIITCALNEGWKLTFENGEERYYVNASIINNKVDLNSLCVCDKNCGIGYNESRKLLFKSSRLAEYAAIQFRDIYMDFCYKGKE